MKSIKLIVTLLVTVIVAGGCAVNADAVNNITYPTYDESVDDSDTVPPYGYEIETVIEDLEEPKIEIRNDYQTVSGGASFIYNTIEEGTRGYRSVEYIKTYNKDNTLLSRIKVPGSEKVEPSTNTIIANGQKATAGAFFTTNRITRYGVDCYGCNMGSDGRGGTSSGIRVGKDEVQQSDGSWKKGVTYEGYYVIATSSAIPLCTIVEISGHSISGVPSTFKAIVLDRGGAITGTKIDLFAGSESNPLTGHMPSGEAKVTIISTNGRYKNDNGWNCDI